MVISAMSAEYSAILLKLSRMEQIMQAMVGFVSPTVQAESFSLSLFCRLINSLEASALFEKKALTASSYSSMASLGLETSHIPNESAPDHLSSFPFCRRNYGLGQQKTYMLSPVT